MDPKRLITNILKKQLVNRMGFTDKIWPEAEQNWRIQGYLQPHSGSPSVLRDTDKLAVGEKFQRKPETEVALKKILCYNYSVPYRKIVPRIAVPASPDAESATESERNISDDRQGNLRTGYSTHIMRSGKMAVIINLIDSFRRKQHGK